MKRNILPIAISSVTALTLTGNALAAEIKVSGDLELYYDSCYNIQSQDNDYDCDFNCDRNHQNCHQFKTQKYYPPPDD